MDKTQESIVLERQLIALLEKGQAHITVEDALKGIRPENCGKRIDSLPYTIWQMTEHLRITQKDILEFSRDPNYESPDWPEGYWPKETSPKSHLEWEKCIQAIADDRKAFIQLLEITEDIFAPFSHGDGQNMLREALLIADHNAYHCGQIIVMRRLLNNYK